MDRPVQQILPDLSPPSSSFLNKDNGRIQSIVRHPTLRKAKKAKSPKKRTAITKDPLLDNFFWVLEQCSIALQIHLLIERKAVFVINHSAGKDSKALFALLCLLIPKEQIVVIHAHLPGVEWKDALPTARADAEQRGLPFVVSQASKKFLEMVKHRYDTRPEVPSWPNAETRQCTSDLKRTPSTREIKHWSTTHHFGEDRYAIHWNKRVPRTTTLFGQKVILYRPVFKKLATKRVKVVNCMGMRAQESPKRSKMDQFCISPEDNRDWEWYNFLPLKHFRIEEIWKTLIQNKMMPHPAYLKGSHRVSCLICILGSANDARIGAIEDPNNYLEYILMEEYTGYTMHPGVTLVEYTGLTAVQAFMLHDEMVERTRTRVYLRCWQPGEKIE